MMLQEKPKDVRAEMQVQLFQMEGPAKRKGSKVFKTWAAKLKHKLSVKR